MWKDSGVLCYTRDVTDTEQSPEQEAQTAALSVVSPHKKRIGTGLAGPGRPKGVPNRSTSQARENVSFFISANVPKLNRWLEDIERVNGSLAAFTALVSLLEYHVPKLARTEITGANDGPIAIEITWRPPNQ